MTPFTPDTAWAEVTKAREKADAFAAWALRAEAQAWEAWDAWMSAWAFQAEAEGEATTKTKALEALEAKAKAAAKAALEARSAARSAEEKAATQCDAFLRAMERSQ